MGNGPGSVLIAVTSELIESSRRVQIGNFTRLRPIHSDDAEITLRWRLSNRARLLNKGAETVAEQRSWIQSRPSSELNYVIETRKSQPVGCIALIDINFVHRRAESARFLIGEEESARGFPIAVEAMKLLYEVAFDQLKLLRVYGVIAEDNALMLKWQKYLGMKEEGRLRRHSYINGRFQDHIAVGIFDSEFREVTLPRMNGLIALAGINTKEPHSD
jgi:RimJ/RimL family protein N-acetyltransferase